MVPGENHLATGGSERPINATLLKLIHHELGNGLAVLSGYRRLLDRAISLQAHEMLPPEPDVWRQRNTQWAGYLRVMHDRETLLKDFLALLRELSPGTLPERLCQHFERADLGMLLGRVIERLAPLSPEQTLRVHLPAKALFLRCDAFWLELVLEHLVGHTIAAHTASTPVDISLESSSDPTLLVQEATIAIQIERTLPASPPEREELSEPWSPVLNQSDRECCFAMCREVLQEHEGRIWWERGAEHQEVLFLTLPLVEEGTG